MKTTFVLLMFVYYHGAVSQEFFGREACEAAAKVMVEVMEKQGSGGSYDVRWACVQKEK